MQQLFVLHDGEDGVINAGKGLKALGIGLSCARAEDDLAVEYDLNAARAVAGVKESVGQVALGVGAVKPDGLLRARDNDGLGAVLDQIAEGRGGVGHGVGAVRNDEAVVLVIMRADGLRESQPVLGADVGAVQIVALNAVHLAVIADVGNEFKQLIGVKLGGKSVGRDVRGDGATRADHENFFHSSPCNCTNYIRKA